MPDTAGRIRSNCRARVDRKGRAQYPDNRAKPCPTCPGQGPDDPERTTWAWPPTPYAGLAKTESHDQTLNKELQEKGISVNIGEGR